MKIDAVNARLSTCRVEPTWKGHVELDARVRRAATKAADLAYGPFDGAAFESDDDTQYVRGQEVSVLGTKPASVEIPVRLFSVTVPQEPETLTRAIEAVRKTHSYQDR